MFKGKLSGEPILVIASGKNRANEKIIAENCGEQIEKAHANFCSEDDRICNRGTSVYWTLLLLKP